MKTAELAEVCAITMGQAPAGESYNDRCQGVPLIAGAGDFGSGVPFAKKFTTAAAKLCAPGDIILSIRASIGARVLADGVYALGRGVAGLRPKDGLDARYLWHWLGWASGRLASKGRGATFLQVNRADIAEMTLALPPIEDQRRIAGILDRADALRAKRREALALLDDLTQSIFVDMFGDPLSNPQEFPTSPLSELGRVTTGGTPASSRKGMFGDVVPFITPGDLGRSGAAKRMLSLEGAAAVGTVRAGASLVCCIGATIGKVGYARESSSFNQQINAVEWSNAIHDLYGYFSLRWRRDVIADAGTSTTLPILNKSGFQRLTIPVPPAPLQDDFARRVEAVDSVSGRGAQCVVESDELFGSLQQRAFAGLL